MMQHLVCAQWKNHAATGQTVTLKGCQKQVGREGMSGLGLDLSLLTFYCEGSLSQVRNKGRMNSLYS